MSAAAGSSEPQARQPVGIERAARIRIHSRPFRPPPFAQQLIALVEPGQGTAIVSSTVRFVSTRAHAVPLVREATPLGVWGGPARPAIRSDVAAACVALRRGAGDVCVTHVSPSPRPRNTAALPPPHSRETEGNYPQNKGGTHPRTRSLIWAERWAARPARARSDWSLEYFAIREFSTE